MYARQAGKVATFLWERYICGVLDKLLTDPIANGPISLEFRTHTDRNLLSFYTKCTRS